MAGKVLRRLSTAFLDTDRKRKPIEEPKGAAIPYPEPEPSTPGDDEAPYDHPPPHLGSNGDPIITKRSVSTVSGSSSNGVTLCRMDSSDPAEVATWREEVREAVDERETVRLRGLLMDADPDLIDGIDYVSYDVIASHDIICYDSIASESIATDGIAYDDVAY